MENVQIRRVDNAAIVTFLIARIIEDRTIDEIGDQLYELANENLSIIADFQHTQFISSMMLAKLIALDKRTRNRGQRLLICGIRPEIHEVLAITRLDRLFPIERDEAAALAKLADLKGP